MNHIVVHISVTKPGPDPKTVTAEITRTKDPQSWEKLINGAAQEAAARVVAAIEVNP